MYFLKTFHFKIHNEKETKYVELWVQPQILFCMSILFFYQRSNGIHFQECLW